MCPERLPTPFEAWSFTEEEEPVAFVFTELQSQHIKTELAAAAVERSKLTLNPDNMIKSFGELEYLRGKIEGYELLLTMSEDKQNALQEALRNAVENQQGE